MKEERYFYVPDAATRQTLPDEETVHAVRVLRLTAGDEMMLMDGSGTFYEAEVTETSAKRCAYHIKATLPQTRQWPGHVHLAVAPTKMMDRTEWLVEKATEVGIDELSLLNCQFSERRAVKLPRLEKIAVAAMKQSRKPWLPQLNDMQDFRHFIKWHATGRRYIAHCYTEIPRENLFDCLRQGQPDEDALVMIGPEGDFSFDEVQMAIAAGFVSVDLGKSRLRTETAGLAAVMMMQLAKGL
ncbi:MAG: 16S rRNA (uracil(1498)-N(3))-methyltransferase [Prevotella sp.]|nr:16S rRNA (uracil(1498)-N(3))-methyltransferase [Prevotella sp.]